MSIERTDVIVDGVDDGAADGGHLIVEVDDQGVLLTGVGHQAVALKYLRIVLVDLALDVGILNAGVDGQ